MGENAAGHLRCQPFINKRDKEVIISMGNGCRGAGVLVGRMGFAKWRAGEVLKKEKIKKKLRVVFGRGTKLVSPG